MYMAASYPDFGSYRPILLYIQIDIETFENGRRRAKCTRLPSPPSDERTMSVHLFGVHCWGDTVNNWTPTINHTHVIEAHLFWQPEYFAQKQITDTVEHRLQRYIKSLINNDDDLRTTIQKRLKGTGWYFGRDFFK